MNINFYRISRHLADFSETVSHVSEMSQQWIKNLFFVIISAGLIAALALFGLSIWVVSVAHGPLFELMQLLMQDLYPEGGLKLSGAPQTLLVVGGINVVLSVFSIACGLLSWYERRTNKERVISPILMALPSILGFVSIGFMDSFGISHDVGVNSGLIMRTKLMILDRNYFQPLSLALKQNSTTEAKVTMMINHMQVQAKVNLEFDKTGRQCNTSAKQLLNNKFIQFECCGTNGYWDITGNTTLWHKSSPTYKGIRQVLPVSCCPMQSKRAGLLKDSNWNSVGSYLLDPECPNTGRYPHRKGCYDALKRTAAKYYYSIHTFSIFVTSVNVSI
uniref:Tetraspanin n=1 Tax=Macrostomum lignano TaxID=282301 RepID=A0A1I8HEK7_9PLAT